MGTRSCSERNSSCLDEHVPACQVSLPSLPVLCHPRSQQLTSSYDWFKEELIRNKLLADGPVCHFVASVGAVGLGFYSLVRS